MNFGERLKAVRKEKKISQRELGERLGVSQQTIAQYEKAQSTPKADTILKLANALELDDLSLLIEMPPSRAVMWAHRKEILGKNFLQLFASSTDGAEKFLNGTSYKDLADQTAETENQKTKIIYLYDQLNAIGQQKAIEQVEMLTKIPEYRAEPQNPAADTPTPSDQGE